MNSMPGSIPVAGAGSAGAPIPASSVQPSTGQFDGGPAVSHPVSSALKPVSAAVAHGAAPALAQAASSTNQAPAASLPAATQVPPQSTQPPSYGKSVFSNAMKKLNTQYDFDDNPPPPSLLAKEYPLALLRNKINAKCESSGLPPAFPKTTTTVNVGGKECHIQFLEGRIIITGPKPVDTQAVVKTLKEKAAVEGSFESEYKGLIDKLKAETSRIIPEAQWKQDDALANEAADTFSNDSGLFTSSPTTPRKSSEATGGILPKAEQPIQGFLTDSLPAANAFFGNLLEKLNRSKSPGMGSTPPNTTPVPADQEKAPPLPTTPAPNPPQSTTAQNAATPSDAAKTGGLPLQPKPTTPSSGPTQSATAQSTPAPSGAAKPGGLPFQPKPTTPSSGPPQSATAQSAAAPSDAAKQGNPSLQPWPTTPSSGPPQSATAQSAAAPSDAAKLGGRPLQPKPTTPTWPTTPAPKPPQSTTAKNADTPLGEKRLDSPPLPPRPSPPKTPAPPPPTTPAPTPPQSATAQSTPAPSDAAKTGGPSLPPKPATAAPRPPQSTTTQDAAPVPQDLVGTQQPVATQTGAAVAAITLPGMGTVSPLKTPTRDAADKPWKGIDSSNVQSMSGVLKKFVQKKDAKGNPTNHGMREQFLDSKTYKPDERVDIVRSDFIPDGYAHHLLEKKKWSAIGSKYTEGDNISDMQGFLHTFLLTQSVVRTTGDYVYDTDKNPGRGHAHIPLTDGNKTPGYRNIVLSTNIHPDGEQIKKRVVDKNGEEVVRPIPGSSLLVAAMSLDPSNETTGLERLPEIPTADDLKNGTFREGYDQKVKQYMIHHLTAEGKIPSVQEIKSKGMLYPTDKAQAKIESLLNNDSLTPEQITKELQQIYIQVPGSDKIISGEMLFMTYVHQQRNEFSNLESRLTDGYVYVFDPPSIFAQDLGGVKGGQILMNRFQMIATKYLIQSGAKLDHLKAYAFNDYIDPESLKFWEKTGIPKDKLMAKNAISKRNKGFVLPQNLQGLAIVDHNNSDGFGNNIKNETPSGSKDGELGSICDAACQLTPEKFKTMQLPPAETAR